jgi:anti-sigma factor RsiW
MSSAGQPVPEDDLHAYVDNRLDPDRRAAVARFLAANPDASVRVTAYSAQRDGLRAALAKVAETPLPPGLDLRALIRQRGARRLAMSRRSTWRLAAGVVLALGLGGSGGWLMHGALMPRPNDVAELAREAMANHVLYTAEHGRPTELGADQGGDLSRWVSDWLKVSVRPPDLSSAGFRFLGSRLAATAAGPAGMFMYHDNTVGWLTVFVRPFPGAPTVPMRAVESGGLDGCAWIEKGMGYMVVARLPRAEVRDVARQVQQQLAAAI